VAAVGVAEGGFEGDGDGGGGDAGDFHGEIIPMDCGAGIKRCKMQRFVRCAKTSLIVLTESARIFFANTSILVHIVLSKRGRVGGDGCRSGENQKGQSLLPNARRSFFVSA
jgi:hypothetical protein